MRSRNQRSWLMMTAVPANSPSASSSARSVSTSRSFDGSSSSSTLPPFEQRLARCRRPRSPPERLPTIFAGLALEVEAANVGAALHLEAADLQDVGAAGDVLPHRFVVLQVLARLIDEGHLHRVADDDLAAVGLLDAGDQFEQRRLTGAVGARSRRRWRPAGCGTTGHQSARGRRNSW